MNEILVNNYLRKLLSKVDNDIIALRLDITEFKVEQWKSSELDFDEETIDRIVDKFGNL